MDFTAFFEQQLFSFGTITLTVGGGIALIGLLLFLYFFWHFLTKKIFPRLPDETSAEIKLAGKIKKFTSICFGLILAIALVYALNVNAIIYQHEDPDNSFSLRVSSILTAVLVLYLARLFDWGMTDILAEKWKNRKERKGISMTTQQEGLNNNIIQPFIYTLAVFFIIQAFSLNIQFFTFIKNGIKTEFRLSNIITAILILLGSRMIAWIINHLILAFYFTKERKNVGSQYAVNQLVKYFVFTIALLFAIQTLGINLTLIWGGAAALLVGIGLGLQQLFHDLSCGFILLFERTVEVGDILELQDMFGEVKKIGLRTSIIETNDDITVIIPNSKLVSDSVINWSHDNPKARFHLTVSAAYGADAIKVRTILEEVAQNCPAIRKSPKPFVRFSDFGDSALIFELHFWTSKLLEIENTKSTLRFAVYEAFNDNGIEIPFPQRDVWIKEQ